MDPIPGLNFPIDVSFELQWLGLASFSYHERRYGLEEAEISLSSQMVALMPRSGVESSVCRGRRPASPPSRATSTSACPFMRRTAFLVTDHGFRGPG